MKINTKNMSREEKAAWAKKLRDSGRTYTDIDILLSLPRGKAWQILNKERYAKSCRESSLRWRQRGCIALCEMPE